MKRGDVVEVSWPYSDLSGTKVRPALVVQADSLNGILDDTILVKITGNRYGIPNTEVLLDPTVETASDTVMRQIEVCLKAVLNMP